MRDDTPVLLRPEPGPATLKTVPWGGTRLASLRGAPPSAAPVGESWEFSTLPGSGSRAGGRALQEVLGEPLPFLAKLIDTEVPLSIQVHPSDDGDRPGKEEAWVILDATPGAAVRVGVREDLDDAGLHAAMLAAIAQPGHGRALIDALTRIEVTRGMVIVVPAGTVHAIGGGILLAEIQQPVDCTFRLFDYGSDRPIHPEQARAAWRIDARADVWRPGDPPRVLHGRHVALHVHGPGDTILPAAGTPRLLVAVGGAVHATAGGETWALAHGDLLLHTRDTVAVHVAPDATLVTGIIDPAA